MTDEKKNKERKSKIMEKHFCDHCGKPLDSNNGRELVISKLNASYRITLEAELCAECCLDIKNWINEPKRGD